MNESARFRLFVEAHRDKLRKKWRTAPDEDGQWDVLAEIYAAYMLARDKHVTLAYETFIAGGQRGPDFTAMYTTRFSFHVEVTRMRAVPTSIRWAEALIDKLPQMRPSGPNVLFVATQAVPGAASDLSATMQQLRLHAEGQDDSFFVARGSSGRDFIRGLLRLSAIAWYPGWAIPPADQPVLWVNPTAKHPLPSVVATILLARPG